MILFSKKVLVPILSLAFLASCKTGKSKTGSELESEVSGTSDNVPSSLGKGFDSETQTLKSKCVDGTPVWAGAQEANLTYQQDLDFESMLKTFGGGGNVGVKLSIFDVKGAAEFASREAADDFSSTISILNKVTIKKKVLDDVRFTENTKKNLIKNGKVVDSVRVSCGDEYFSTIVYGAELFVNAKFSFKSKQDKTEFKGNASVSLAAIGELGGQISHLSDSLKKNSRVSITARQIGGDTDKLSSILSSEVITCSLADFEAKCLPMLTRIVNYAKDDIDGFRGGLKDIPDPAAKESAKGWAQTRFITTPFASEEIEGVFLEPGLKKSILNAEIKAGRDEVYETYQKQLLDNQRASTLLNTYALTDLQRRNIEGIRDATNTNKSSLVELADICLHKPTQCVAELKTYRTKAKPYVASLLNLTICLQESDLVNTTWTLGRSNGTTISPIKFLSNGKLDLWTSQFETSWIIQDCQLRILNQWGVHSTIFDEIISTDRMTGLFIQDKNFRHTLDRKI